MSDILSELITSLRGSTMADSVTPDMIGYLLELVRAEAVRVAASAATSGTVDISPITRQLDSLENRLSSHLRLSSDTLNSVAPLQKRVDELAQALTRLQGMVDDATVSVDAPALLPFFGISATDTNPLNASTMRPVRAIFDAWNGCFVAQAANSDGGFNPPSFPGACYTGNVAMYNREGKARTDLLYIYDSSLWSFDGKKLVRHTEPPQA